MLDEQADDAWKTSPKLRRDHLWRNHGNMADRNLFSQTNLNYARAHCQALVAAWSW